MRFAKTKLLKTIRRKNDGWTTYQVRKIAHISIRRINQAYNKYLKTGKIPEIGKKTGRPSKPITDEEIRIVKETYLKCLVSASTIRKVIDRDYNLRINHNRIHKILIYLDYAKHLNKKHKPKLDWIRYERRHSLTAAHINLYYDPTKELEVFDVIGDASNRYFLDKKVREQLQIRYLLEHSEKQ